MSQYSAAVPSGDLVRPEIRTYFERFYQVSDTADAHEQYADLFTKDATLIMASNSTSRREGKLSLDPFSTNAHVSSAGIIKMRHGMWDKVAKRSHKPAKIFPFGSGSDDIMLFGEVHYELKDGRRASVEWAARAHFTNAEGDLKMDFYQVYLDSAAMTQAK